MVAWPHPNVWTQRPAAIDAAIAEAAFLMFSSWVVSIRSITPRAWLSHSSASMVYSSSRNGICFRCHGSQPPPQEQEEHPLSQQPDGHDHEGRPHPLTVSQHARQVRQ